MTIDVHDYDFYQDYFFFNFLVSVDGLWYLETLNTISVGA